MINVYIERVSDGYGKWIPIPNEELKQEIDLIADGRDWIVADLESTLLKNCFKLVNLIELNEALLELEEYNHFDTNDISNLSLLNMLLEDRHHNIDEAITIIKDGEYAIYTNVEDIGDMARRYLEETSIEYTELMESDSVLVRYIDYKSYGEEVLMEDGQFLIDEDNKIIVNMYIK